MPSTVLELTVRNHPGVMSHITGLFARRAYNLEGIACGPLKDGATSRMYLLVKKAQPLEQIMKQVEKLYDVHSVTLRNDCNTGFFYTIRDVLEL